MSDNTIDTLSNNTIDILSDDMNDTLSFNTTTTDTLSDNTTDTLSDIIQWSIFTNTRIGVLELIYRYTVSVNKLYYQTILFTDTLGK